MLGSCLCSRSPGPWQPAGLQSTQGWPRGPWKGVLHTTAPGLSATSASGRSQQSPYSRTHPAASSSYLSPPCPPHKAAVRTGEHMRQDREDVYMRRTNVLPPEMPPMIPVVQGRRELNRNTIMGSPGVKGTQRGRVQREVVLRASQAPPWGNGTERVVRGPRKPAC